MVHYPNISFLCFHFHLFNWGDIVAFMGGAYDKFILIYNEYKSKTMGLCRTIMRNEQDALDAFQDTYIRAWKYLSRGGEVRNVSAWIYEVAKNSCFAIRNSKKLLEELTQILQSSQPIAERSHLYREIEKLPHTYKLIITFHLMGYENHEIATIVGSTPKSVEHLKWKIKKKLAGEEGSV